MEFLKKQDPKIYEAIKNEVKRQEFGLELIASENFVSRAVLEAVGSVMTNKYAEGYPGKRYYGGCEFVDVAEELADERAKELFGAEYANTQPLSGSSANMAVYFAVCEPGDTVMAMSLDHGGHLTHGHKVNFSGKLYNIVSYGVDKNTHLIDYDQMRDLAKEHKPKMIIAGATAYSRTIDYKAFREVADEVDAVLMADMAHPAGLVAAGVHPSPVPYCDYVTSTTHKTLRGPRGGLILSTEEAHKKVKSRVFPGIQGGPLMHVVAGKAVAFGEALQDDFKTYGQQVVGNAQALSKALMDADIPVLTNGTDNHQVILDLTNFQTTGADAELALEKAHMTTNKNMIPFDKRSPMVTSGVRLGTSALTTRKMTAKEMTLVGEWMAKIIKDPSDAIISKVKSDVIELSKQFPLYSDLLANL